MASRVWIGLFSAALGGLVVALFWRGSGADRTRAPLVEIARSEAELLAEEWTKRQGRFDLEHPPVWVQLFEDSPLRREHLSEAAAKRLLRPLREGSALVHDPFTAFRRRSNQRTEVPFAEHPDGAWMLATNAQGVREDEPLRPGPFALEILAGGDSHSEGACHNRESWPQRLEARLAQDLGPEAVDVWNGACQGFSAYNHLGLLERYLSMGRGAPRAYVLAIYAGNDFYELLHYRHYFLRRPRPHGWGRYLQSVQPFRETHGTALAQIYEQALYFRHNPEEEREAMVGMVEVLHEIQRLCDQRGIYFLPLWLPTAADVEWHRHRELFEPLAAALELSPRERAYGPRLFAELKAALPTLDWLDLTEALEAAPEGSYWRLDQHLSVAGQQRVAAAVWARLAERNIPDPRAALPAPGSGAATPAALPEGHGPGPDPGR